MTQGNKPNLKPNPNHTDAFRRANEALRTLRSVLPASEYEPIESQTVAALCRTKIAEVVR